MRIGMLLAEMGMTGSAAFVAAAATTLLWSLGVHGAPAVDLATSARLAVSLGVVLPVSRRLSARWAARACASRRSQSAG